MTRLLFTLAAPLVLLAVWFYLMQPSMVFLPMRQLDATPAMAGLAYEEVRIRTADGVSLHGWYLPGPHPSRTLLFFHGNAGNISHRLESLQLFHQLGLAVLIIDYRGYGLSEGSPSETGLYQDASAAWRYLTGQRGIDAADIVLFGRSLGGAVAARLAAEVKPAALILESSFSSARDFVGQAFPLLSWLIVLRYQFDSLQALRSVHCPVLVLHSPQDEVIPYTLGRKLFEAAPSPKRFQQLRGDHNSGFLLSQPEYQQALTAFLTEELGQ